MLAKKIRILICDDCELFSLGIKSIIEKMPDYETLPPIRNGHEAISAMESMPPDMVIVESDLPGLNGLKLTKFIKANYSNTKVLVVSRESHADSFYNALKSGADGFCLKQTMSTNMMLAIESVARGGFWADASATPYFKASISAHKMLNAENVKEMSTFALSARERQVLESIKDGLSNIEIAARLHLSPETIKTHIKHIFEKLAVRHRTEAVIEALKRGLISAA